MPSRYRIFFAISVVLLAALACGLEVRSKATPTVPVADTPAASDTAPAEATTTPPAPTVASATETETPIPDTETATVSIGVATETSTPTLEPVYATVMKNTNCRTGPSGSYDLVTSYVVGTKLQVIARDLGGGFVFIQDPNNPNMQCYILVNNVQLSGDASVFPQYTPLPSPTAAPGFNAAFKKYDSCQGDVYAVFTIVNIGSVPFRSAYVKVTNLKTGDSTEWSVNAFDQWTACIIAKNISPLGPGASGFLRSDLFLHDPRGNKMRAIIQACTEKNLKGICKNTVIQFQ